MGIMLAICSQNIEPKYISIHNYLLQADSFLARCNPAYIYADAGPLATEPLAAHFFDAKRAEADSLIASPSSAYISGNR